MSAILLSLVLTLSLLPVYAASHPVNALSDQNGHPGGHLGKSWEIAVGVSLGLLLFGAAVTIAIVTMRQRRRRLYQSQQPGYPYASHPPPALLPSMPYGISRPPSVYQPRDKHGRKSSPDRSGRLKESV